MTMFVILDDDNAREVEIADPSELCAIEYTYATSGSYEVTVLLHNARSSQEAYSVAAVCTPITGAVMDVTHVEHGSGQNNVLTINATTGTMMKAQVIEPDGSLSEYCFDSLDDLAPIELTFTDVGTYQIDVDLSNALSSVHLTQEAGVYVPITGFEFDVPTSAVEVNTMVFFTQRFGGGSHVTCSRQFGDGSSLWRVYEESASAETTWNHTYTSTGEYIVSLHCYNFGHSYYIKRSVFVTDPIVLEIDSTQLAPLGEEFMGFQTSSQVLQVTATWNDVALSSADILYDGTVHLPHTVHHLRASATNAGVSGSEYNAVQVMIPMPHLQFVTPGRVLGWNVMDRGSGEGQTTYKLAVLRPTGSGYIFVGEHETTTGNSNVYQTHWFHSSPIYIQPGDTIGFTTVSGQVGLNHQTVTCGNGILEEVSCTDTPTTMGELLVDCVETGRCVDTRLQAIYEQIDPTAHLHNAARHGTCSVATGLDTSTPCEAIINGQLLNGGYLDMSTNNQVDIGSVTLTLSQPYPIYYLRLTQGANSQHSIKDLNIRFDEETSKNVQLRHHAGTSHNDPDHMFWDYIAVAPPITAQSLTFTPTTYHGDLHNDVGFFEIEVYTNETVADDACDADIVDRDDHVNIFPEAASEICEDQHMGTCRANDECVLKRMGGMVKIRGENQVRGNNTLVITATGFINTVSLTQIREYVEPLDAQQITVSHTPDLSQAGVADTDICVVIGAGSHITITIDYGDQEAGESRYEELPDRVGTVCFTHRYNTVGILTATLNLTNIIGSEVFTETIPSLKMLTAMSLVGESIVDLSAGPYSLTVDVQESDPVPTNVSCDVTFESALGATTYPLQDYTGSVSSAILHTYELADLGSHTISATCTNAVSSDHSDTLDVEVIQPLSDALLTIDHNYVTLGQQVTFTVRRTEGSHAGYEFNFGDGNTQTDEFDPEGTLPVESEIFYTHQYGAVANVTASIRSHSPISDVTQTFPEIIVQRSVPDLQMHSDIHFVACPPGIVHVTIEKITASDPDPTDIFLAFDIPNVEMATQYVTLPHSQDIALSCARAGNLTVHANVSNFVSSDTMSLQLTVQAIIVGPEFRVITPYVRIGEDAILDIAFLQGSHIEFEIAFNDGSENLIFSHPNQTDSTAMQTLRHAYNSNMNITVTLTASNDVTIPAVTIDSPPIVVQTPLSELELIIVDEVEEQDNIIAESNDVHYVLQVSDGATAGLANNIFMNWTYGDTTLTEMTYTDILTVDAAYHHVHTLPDGVLGNVTTTVYSYNQVSNATAQVTFTVQQEVGDLSVSASSSAEVGEVVELAVTCTAGTSVRLAMIPGDGGEVDSWEDELQTTRVHAYTSPGTYTITVSAYNDVSTATPVEVTIVVQYPLVVDLVRFSLPPAVLSTDGSVGLIIEIIDGDTPTSVMLDIDDDSDVPIEHFPYTHYIHYDNDLANHQLTSTVRLHNLVSEVTHDVTTTVVEPLGMFIAPDVPVVSTEETLVLDFELTTGSNLQVYVTYGDGLPEILLDVISRGTFSVSTLYPDPGEYSMIIRAENILLQTTNITLSITAQNVIKSDELLFELSDDDQNVLLNEDVLSLAITVTGSRIPTDTLVEVDFGEGQHIYEVHDFTQPFSASYTYGVVGSFTITVKLSNNVTEELVQTYEVQVLEGVQLEGIKLIKKPENIEQTEYNFALPVDLSFVALTTAGTSVTYTWVFVEETHETSLPTIDHLFTLPGEKLVTLTASNLVSSVTETITLNIIANMAIEGIDISNPVIKSNNATYTTRLRDPDDVCFMFKVFNIDVDDNDDIPEETFWIGVSSEVCRRSETLAPGTTFANSEFVSFPSGKLIGTTDRLMDTIAEYRVEIKAFTQLSEPYDMTKSLSVIAKPCFPPVVTNRPGQGATLTNPVQFRRSSNNFLGTENVEITVNCERTSSVKKYWTVGTCDETGALIREIQIEAEGGTKGEAGVNFPKATLMYGMHCYNLTVTMDGYPEFNASTTLYANVFATPIEASINGKESQRVGHGVTMEINVEDYVADADETDEPVTYEYLCALREETMPDDLPLVTVPRSQFTTLYGNTDAYTGCFNTGPGRLDITEGKYELYTGHFLAGRFYNLTVLVTKGTRRTSASTLLEIAEGNPPDINIECKPDNYCPTKVSTQDIIQVWVFSTQLANVAADHVTYTWTGCVDVEKSVPDADLSVFDSDGCIQLTPISVTYTDGSPASRVTIQANSLPEGVTFDLTVTLAVVGRAPGLLGKSFQFNMSPRGGACHGSPQTGLALSEFSLICQGWNDEGDMNIWEPLPTLDSSNNHRDIRIRHEMRVGEVVKELYTDEPFLSTGDPNNDYKVIMTSYIADGLGDTAAYTYEIQVNHSLATPAANLSEEVSFMGTAKALSYFSSLVGNIDAQQNEESAGVPGADSPADNSGDSSSSGDAEGRPQSRQQQQLLLQQQQAPDPKDEMIKAVAANLAKMLSDPSVGSDPEALEAVFATSKSTLESRTANYPASSQIATIDLTSDMAARLAAAGPIDRKQQNKMAADVLSMVNSNVKVAPEEPEEVEIEAEATFSEEDLDAHEEMLKQQAEEAAKVQQQLAVAVESTTDNLEKALQKSLTIDGEPQEIEAQNMKMLLQKATGAGLDNQSFGSKDGGVALPAVSGMLSGGGGGGGTGQADGNSTQNQALVFSYVYLESNIYNYDDSAKDIDSGVSTLALKNEYGEVKSFYDMPEPLEVVCKNPPEAAESAINSSAISVEGDMALVYLPVEKTGSSMVFDIDLPVVVDMNMTMYILKGLSEENLVKPGPDSYDCVEHQVLYAGDLVWESVVPAVCVETPGLMIGIVVAELDTPANRRRRSTDEQNYNYTSLTDYTSDSGDPHTSYDYQPTGRVIRKRRAAVDEPPGTEAGIEGEGGTLLNNTVSSMTMRSVNSLCKSWNKTTSSWMDAACNVSAKSTITETVCECKEMSKQSNSYGSGFSMPKVNTIDFGKVFGNFGALLGDNPAVFATVFSILGAYCLLALWARRSDKKDLEKWSVTPLVDNRPKHTHYYKVSVYTGLRQGAGTMSNVCFVVNGEMSDTGVRMLADGKKKGFVRGAVRHFMMSTEGELGELSFVRIWHDNSGKNENAGWFLDKIVVEDLNENVRYFFLCGRWLAADEDDGLVDRILSVAGQEQVNGFGHVFFSTARKNLTDDHLWLSVVSRPTRSNFTRLQRLTCCIVLLFTTMIANAMWYGSVDSMESDLSIRIGPIIITTGTILVAIFGSLTVVPINLIIVQLFRKSKSKKGTKVLKANKKAEKSNIECPDTGKETDEEDQDAKKAIWKRKYPLPYWCAYIGWYLSIMTILASAFFIILYSLDWGKEKAEKWLSALMLSVFQSTIIIQPVKVVLLAMVVSCVFKKLQDDDDTKEEMEEFKKTEEDDELANDPVLMLDRQNAKLSAPEPPSKERLEKIRKEREYKKKVNEMIKEFVYYSLYVCLISFIAFGQRDEMSYIMNNGMIQMLGVPDLPTQMRFTSVNDGFKFWQWLEETALPAVFYLNKYNGEYTTMRERNYTDDMVSFRVGPLRLRQVRVKPASCKLNELVKELIIECNTPYSIVGEEDRNFTMDWFVSNGTDLPEELTSLDKAYLYNSMISLRGLPYMGIMGTYGGGGYVAELGGSQLKAIRYLHNLKEHNWIDYYTRAVFLEFTVYNPNVNLFSYVNFVMEFPAIGGVMANPRVMTFQVYSSFTAGGMKTMVILAQILFVLIMFYMFVKECIKMYKQKKNYVLDLWNIYDLAVIGVSATCVAMFALREVWGRVVLSEISENKDTYVNYLYLATYDELLMYMLGLILFLATIKLLRLLRFNKHVWVLVGTLIYARWELFYFAITFFIFMFGFATLGHVVFGSGLIGFSSFIRTLESLYSMLLGKFDFQGLELINRILGPVYFVIFVVMMFFIIMNMFLGILGESFTMMRSTPGFEQCEYQVIDYMVNAVKEYVGVNKRQQEHDRTEVPAEQYVDPIDTLEKRLTSIDRYLTNDYIEETLFAKNKKSYNYEPEVDAEKSKMDYKDHLNAIKNMFTPRLRRRCNTYSGHPVVKKTRSDPGIAGEDQQDPTTARDYLEALKKILTPRLQRANSRFKKETEIKEDSHEVANELGSHQEGGKLHKPKINVSPPVSICLPEESESNRENREAKDRAEGIDKVASHRDQLNTLKNYLSPSLRRANVRWKEQEEQKQKVQEKQQECDEENPIKPQRYQGIVPALKLHRANTYPRRQSSTDA